MKVITYAKGSELADYGDCVIKSVPCYLSDAVDELVLSTLDQDKKNQWSAAEKFVRDSLRVGNTYIASGVYLDENGMMRRKTKGHSYFYYFATNELDQFVYEKELFSRLRGDVKRRIKRYRKHLQVSVSAPSQNHHIQHWPIKPRHVKGVVIANLREL